MGRKCPLNRERVLHTHRKHTPTHPLSLSPPVFSNFLAAQPWLPTEIKEQRHWDISAGERFDILKSFVKYGLEHWGSDDMGIANTRRFLLEWMSFLCRYVPVGLLEVVPQQLQHKPKLYHGRSDLESLLGSTNVSGGVVACLRSSSVLFTACRCVDVFPAARLGENHGNVAGQGAGRLQVHSQTQSERVLRARRRVLT